MITTMKTATKQQLKDIRLIGAFVEVYCAGNHAEMEKRPFLFPEKPGERLMCAECAGFMDYAVARRRNCSLEAEKPTCKRCRIHCYDTLHREKVREVMSYSGRKLLLMGRLDYLWHYFF